MVGVIQYLSDCRVELLWFDSLGAKSSSLRLRGRGCDVVVDPGAAAMQPSYPLPKDEKVRLKERAQARLRDALASPRVKVVIITHYHHDHYPWPGSEGLPPQLLKGKLIIAKNPKQVHKHESVEEGKGILREPR